MITKRDIDMLVSRLLRDGKAVSHETVERDYVQSWILISLSETVLKNMFLFKGGTALRKIYFPDYRFSADLDFTHIGNEQRQTALSIVKKEFGRLYENLKRQANLQCTTYSDRDETGEQSFTFYINYSGPLAADIHKRDIKVNITFDEQIVCGTVEKSILKNYEEYSDLPEQKKLYVYSIEEIFIEELCCILDRARHEPRDIYDLWYLLNEESIKLKDIKFDLTQKAKHKRVDPNNFSEILEHKKKTYSASWGNRLKDQLPGGQVPPLDGVYRKIRRVFKQVI